MLSRKLVKYLKEQHVRYHVLEHPKSYSASATAEAAHISGKHLAKSVILKVNGEMRMFVMPANEIVNLEEMRETFGTDDVQLAHEYEFNGIFADCEPGSMPPFGNLYDMPVYVSPMLENETEIAFNAGDHSNLVEMNFNDYERIVGPCVMHWEDR